MAKLAIRQAGAEEKIYDLKEDVVRVGRSSACQVTLDDKAASRQHCELTRTPAGYRLGDLGAHNPTLLNGRPLTVSVLLAVGDVIRVGRTDLLYVCELGEFAASGKKTARAETPAPAPQPASDATAAIAPAPDRPGGARAPRPEESRGGASPAAEKPFESEIGRRVFESGYKALGPEDLDTGRYEAVAAPAGNVPQRPPAPVSPDDERSRREEEMMRRHFRRRNDQIAKVILFLLFVVLPFCGIVAFFAYQSLTAE